MKVFCITEFCFILVLGAGKKERDRERENLLYYTLKPLVVQEIEYVYILYQEIYPNW
jgi:hypothetical protein